ncbi:DUF1071 domain-containing protein [Aureispira]|nr:DUF1071 domain-containing protein [Aureispira sp.]
MTEKKATLQSRVWKILSRRPVRDGMIEKIRAGNRTLSYLSWAHAHGEMMEALGPEGLVWAVEFQVWEDPRFEGDKAQFLPYLILVDDEKKATGALVRAHLTITDPSTKEVWKLEEYLPVMDNRHKPIARPSSTDLNNSQKRVFAKVCALAGLAHFLYAGEDLPVYSDAQEDTSSPKPQESAPDADVTKAEQAAILQAIKACEDVNEMPSIKRRILVFTDRKNDRAIKPWYNEAARYWSDKNDALKQEAQ